MAIKLSANFLLYEFTKSVTASAHNIKEQLDPSQDVINNLLYLCTNVLQPIRNYIVKSYPTALISLNVTSGYRCEELERLLCWSNFLRWAYKMGMSPVEVDTWKTYFVRKHHPKGMAGDLVLEYNQRIRNDIFKNSIMSIIPTLQFTQIIFERGSENDPEWIHISYDKNDIRNQVFRIK